MPRLFNGFSLLEVIVALGVISLAFGGMAKLAGRTLNASGIIRQDLIAANLAQEGIELVRNLRDANWIEGDRTDSRGNPAGCALTSGTWREGLCDTLGNQQWRIDSVTGALGLSGAGERLQLRPDGEYAYAGGTVTPFRREIELGSPPGSDSEMLVSVTVRWCKSAVATCPGSEQALTVESRLFNWIPQ